MDIFKNYAFAMDQQIERKKFLAQREAADNASHEAVMAHVNGMIASGRAKQIGVIRDISMTDTDRALEDIGKTMRQVRSMDINI